jgi:hypothetical protein
LNLIDIGVYVVYALYSSVVKFEQSLLGAGFYF